MAASDSLNGSLAVHAGKVRRGERQRWDSDGQDAGGLAAPLLSVTVREMT